jgi:hypothetical protein
MLCVQRPLQRQNLSLASRLSLVASDQWALFNSDVPRLFCQLIEATIWMQHPTFAKHPIGEFDVEHFINDFRNGNPRMS